MDETSITTDLAPKQRPDWFVVATMTRLLQGATLGFVLTQTLANTGHHSIVPFVIISAVVCGMAIGTAADFRIHQQMNRVVALIVSLASLIAAVVVLSNASSIFVQSAAAILAGAGISADWCSGNWFARNSLLTERRWKGIRIWNAMLALGLLGGFCLIDSPETVRPGIILLGIMVAAFARFLPPIRATEFQPAQTESADLRLDTGSTDAGHGPASDTVPTPAADQGTDCDETECCGGSSAEFRPTSFLRGVLVGVSGIFAFFGPAMMVLIRAAWAEEWSAVFALLGGNLVGGWLLFTAAPIAGYLVTLLPFLVLAAPAILGAALAPVESSWFLVAAGGSGLFCGGVARGCSAVIGELFSDCSTDPIRTRLIAVSSFAAAVLVLICGLITELSDSVVPGLVCCASVFPAGLIALKSVQSPILSSLGHEDNSSETNLEREDVIAALRQ